MPSYQRGRRVGYGPCLAFKLESLIYLRWEKAVSAATSSRLRLISQRAKRSLRRLMSSMGDHLLEWERLSGSKRGNAGIRVSHLLWRNISSSKGKEGRRRELDVLTKKKWPRLHHRGQDDLWWRQRRLQLFSWWKTPGGYNTFIWQRSIAPNSPLLTLAWLNISHDSFIISALFWGFLPGQVQWHSPANKSTS